jgi:hypothetical protein
MLLVNLLYRFAIISLDIVAGEIVSNIIQTQILGTIPTLEFKLLSISINYKFASHNTLKITCFQMRKIPQKNIRTPQAKGVWRIRYNEMIYKLYDDVALLIFLRLNRVKWAGHVATRDYSLTPPPPQKVMGECFAGTKSVGSSGCR